MNVRTNIHTDRPHLNWSQDESQSGNLGDRTNKIRETHIIISKQIANHRQMYQHDDIH